MTICTIFQEGDHGQQSSAMWGSWAALWWSEPTTSTVNCHDLIVAKIRWAWKRVKLCFCFSLLWRRHPGIFMFPIKILLVANFSHGRFASGSLKSSQHIFFPHGCCRNIFPWCNHEESNPSGSYKLVTDIELGGCWCLVQKQIHPSRRFNAPRQYVWSMSRVHPASGNFCLFAWRDDFQDPGIFGCPFRKVEVAPF